MKGTYQKNVVILPGLCDSSARLGVPNTFSLFMDIAAEHAQHLGIGAADLGKRGLFWLTVRTKVRFYRRPAMMEETELSTWPEQPERLRCCRDYRLCKGDELLAEGRTEWAILDTAAGTLCPAKDIYPPELVIPEDTVAIPPFSRIGDDFSDGEALGEYVVRSTDIDLGGHMNNAAYIRACAGAFSCREWQEPEIAGAEAVFRAPCFEGDRLILQKRSGEGALDLRASLPEGKTVFLMRLVRN